MVARAQDPNGKPVWVAKVTSLQVVMSLLATALVVTGAFFAAFKLFLFADLDDRIQEEIERSRPALLVELDGRYEAKDPATREELRRLLGLLEEHLRRERGER